jgi:molybdenum cofactor guanylyltransferase
MNDRDKGLLPVNGRLLIEHVIQILSDQTQLIIISANRNLTAYRRYTPHVVADQDGSYGGPLFGILSVMQYVLDIGPASQSLLVVPCDMPFLPADLVLRLENARTAPSQAAVAHDGQRLQPLCCLLPLTLKNSLSAFIDTGKRKAEDWILSVNPVVVDFSDISGAFRNVNTPADMELLHNA